VIHEPDGSSRRRRRLDHAESSVDHRSMIVEIALLQAKPGAAPRAP
jgi:hypothetical protein